MSFEAFTPDPHPPITSPFQDSVIANGSRRRARRRGLVAAIASVAVVSAAVPLALRSSDEAELRTDRGSTAQPTVNADTSTTMAPLVEPIVVYGSGSRTDCAAPVLVPTDLPDGFEPIRDPQAKTADWQTAYGKDEARIYVYADFSGDWGDDSDLRDETVRGRPAVLGRSGGRVEGAPDEFVVTWDETTPCTAPYALFSKGLDEDTALRVAQSLRDTTKPDLAAETADARRTYVGRRYTISPEHRTPKIVFEPPASGSVWLIESWHGRDATGGRAMHEVHDGTRRMVFFGEIQGSGDLSVVPTNIWDVLVVDFDAHYACPDPTTFAKVAPGSGRYRQAEKAWRGDELSHRIVEIPPSGITCDTDSETGNHPGPYSD